MRLYHFKWNSELEQLDRQYKTSFVDLIINFISHCNLIFLRYKMISFADAEGGSRTLLAAAPQSLPSCQSR